jgi:hypothetical protein
MPDRIALDVLALVCCSFAAILAWVQVQDQRMPGFVLFAALVLLMFIWGTEVYDILRLEPH